MILLRAGKRQGAGSTPGSYSETMRPPLVTIAPRQLRVGGGVVAVDAAAEYCDRPSAGLEGPAVRLAVDPACEAADDDRPCRGRSSRPSIRATERPYAEHARAPTIATAGLRAAARPHLRGARATPADRESRRAAADSRARPGGCARIVTRACSSVGERYESASATCSGTYLRRTPASAAIVRATRATRARPRPESGSRSTARSSSSEAAAGRRGSSRRSRASAPTTRSRTAADGSPGGAASSSARGRGIATTRSKRSSSARDTFSR